jgi:hypothetical protein
MLHIGCIMRFYVVSYFAAANSGTFPFRQTSHGVLPSVNTVASDDSVMNQYQSPCFRPTLRSL